jgi:hypothetical protein
MSHDMTGYMFAPKLVAVMDELRQIFEAGKSVPIDYASLGANKAKFDAVCEEMYKGMFYAIADTGVKVEAVPVEYKHGSQHYTELTSLADYIKENSAKRISAILHNKYRLLVIALSQTNDVRRYCGEHYVTFTYPKYSGNVINNINALQQGVIVFDAKGLDVGDSIAIKDAVDNCKDFPNLTIGIVGESADLVPALRQRAIVCY